MINTLIDRFNNFIDSLIDDYKEYNLDEETIIFLANKTRNFIGFSEITFMNVIFAALEKVNSVKFQFDDEIKKSKNMITKIFENMNESLNVILKDEDEEEHDCCHGHEHEHHHHVNVDEIQDDVNIIIDNLVFLKKLMNDVCMMVLSSLMHENKNMNEEEFKKNYDNFKEKIKDYENEFKSKFE